MLVKVCCIQDEAELEAAAAAGVTHVGLVGSMPSGPGPIDDGSIRRIAGAAPAAVTTVLLTSRTTAAEIVDHVASTGVRAVQIVTHVEAAVRHAVRAALPEVEIVQVAHVEGPSSLQVAEAMAESADYLLLDSGRPGARTPELGGTGRTHDWRVSERIVQQVGVPVFLAGGLDPSNVAWAIAAVRPAGVDVCSGLRDGAGRLVPERLHRFVNATRSA